MRTYDLRGIQAVDNSNCYRCGGLVMELGKVYGYVGKTCTCQLSGQQPIVPIQPVIVTPQMGWVCPKCNSANNPNKDKCGC